MADASALADDEAEQMTPFAKLYFCDEMIMKYEPLAQAMEMVHETEGKDDEVMREYRVHLTRFQNFSWLGKSDSPKYDLIFYGVSGYTGYLMMQYLKRVALKVNPEKFTFAFAGRTPSKVEEMRNREFAGTPWVDTPVLQMSYDDIFSIIDLVRSAKCIINVAGPYMLTQGEVMIDACIHMGTHYCDISGEVPWTLRLLDLHKKAQAAGVHIIPSAASAGGYPDLGVAALAKDVKKRFGEELRKAICYQCGGGAAQSASGGTLKTRSAMAGAGDDVRAEMANPFSMGGFIPDRDRWGVKYCNIEFGTGKASPKLRSEDLDANISRITEDTHLGIWRGPFTYSYFDTRIVRRSNMLFADLGNECYGRNLNFMEYAMLPAEYVAALAAGQGQGGGASVEQEKANLEASGKYYGAGEGPALEDLEDAWVGYMMWAKSENGHESFMSFVGRDGYFETARMAVETALTLVFDYDKLRFKGGVLTPTVAGGEHLLKRLLNGGMTMKLGEWHTEAERTPPPYPS